LPLTTAACVAPGASFGWRKMIAALERVAGELAD